MTPAPVTRTPMVGRRQRGGAGVVVLLAATAMLLPATPAFAAVVPPSPAFAQTSAQTVSSSFMAQVADMNEDGKPDIVSSQLSGPQGFTIELGTGSGTFSAPVATAVAKQHGVSVGDVNNDGHQDVVTRSNTAGSIQVFFGTGTGAVTAGPVYTIPPRSDGVGASGVYTITLLRDFDNDGKLDLAVPLYYQTVTGYFTILKGDGLGGFANTNTNFNISFSYALDAADLNGDGYLDLVAVDDYLRQLSVFLSDGTGGFHFHAPVLFPLNSSTITALAVGDVNKDGRTDLATASSLGLITYLNDGSGGFTPTTVVGGGRYNVAIADFNGDGFADLASENTSTSGEEFYLGSAAGAFTLGSASYNVGTIARTARAADFNGDGHPDLHVSAYGTNLSRVLSYQGLVGAPAVTTNPSNGTVTAGQTATFTAAASGTPTVQWQRSTDSGATWSDVVGAVSTTYTTPATVAGDDGSQYRAVFTNAISTATTTAATLTVLVAPAVTTQPTDQTADAGSTATFSAAASGNPAPTLQWQRSTDGGTTFTSMAGQTSSTLAVTATSGDGGNQYRVVATNGSGSATSTAATLTVITAPQVTGQPADQTAPSGQEVTFTATASGDPTPTVQWQRSTDGGQTFTDLVGETDPSLTLTAAPADDQTRYRAVFANPGGTATTTAATLTVADAPVVTGTPQDSTVNEGSTATFTSTATGTPTPSVQWQVSTDGGVSFTDVVGATSTTYTTGPVARSEDGDRYRAVFTNATGTATTDAARLTVVAIAGPAQSPPSGPRNLKATQTGPGQVTITWDAPADAGSSPVSGYDVGYGNGGSGNGMTVSGTTRSAVFDGLSVGAYQASVAASNVAGAGPRVRAAFSISGPAPVLPAGAPSTHDISSATPVNHPVSLTLGRGAVLTRLPQHGSAVLNGDGTVTYTPASGYQGLDAFRYRVTSGGGAVTVGTVTVRVGDLPRTGGGGEAEVQWALGLIALGCALLAASRRRPSPA